MQVMDYSSLSVKRTQQIFEELASSAEQGLSSEAVAGRLRTSGYNEVSGRKVSWQDILFRQFKSSFIYLLFAAAVLAFLLGERIDAGMILLFVLINATLGFYQEYRSEHTLQILRQYILTKTRVRRDGKEELVESRLLVPGDVVVVEAGDIIPADLRFFLSHNLMVDESVLSGESAPVVKTIDVLPHPVKEVYQAHNIGFSGSTVVSGKGEGVVFATGRETVIGDVARLTLETVRESSFEKGLTRFSSFILRLILLTLLFVFFANIFIKGGEVNIPELLLFSIALAVSVIPEALPVVTTFSLSRGALHLAKNRVVVKRLSAIEDLGSIDVLCTDKTGTLTENALAVSDISSQKPTDTLFYASLAATFLTEKLKQPNNAFDLALWEKMSVKDRERIAAYGVVSEIPFDPERRRNSVLVRRGNHSAFVVRGAPEVIVPHCVDFTGKKALTDWIASEGRKGNRVIAVAKKEKVADEHYTVADEEGGLSFVGCISFVDPIKKTTEAAIAKAEHLGVQIKILTGDSREVAGAVAHSVGLIPSPDEVIIGEELDALSLAKQHEAVGRYAVFARVSPQQKYTIIHLLQKDNEVGFLGEGINDAPALQIANVALVVAGASDIAREASDIVLLKKSLEVIVDGIKEGREVFANTVKYIKATLTSNFGNFYAVATASLLIDYLPMLPLQILLVNLLSDFPMIAVATDTVDHQELRQPRRYDVREVVLLATTLGLVSTVFDFIFFGYFSRISPEVLQTNWFIGSILTELVLLFSIRSRFFFLRAKRPSGVLFWLTLVAFGTTIVLPFTFLGQTLFHFTPPTLPHLLLILSLVGVYFAVTETVKLFYYRFAEHRSRHA